MTLDHSTDYRTSPAHAKPVRTGAWVWDRERGESVYRANLRGIVFGYIWWGDIPAYLAEPSLNNIDRIV